MNTILDKIRDLTSLDSTKDISFSEAIYRLATINQLCNDNNVVEEVKVEQHKTLEEFCKEQSEVCTDDKKLADLLDRNGNHAMNLKFEIRARWSNKNYANMIITVLANNYITTMEDFMAVFDNPTNIKALAYPQSTNKDDIKQLQKVFPINKLSMDDRMKFRQLYLTANEFNNKTCYDILKDFLGETTVRFYNAIARTEGINTINQLYYYLKGHKLNDVKKIRGIAHIPESVSWLHTMAHRQ